MTLYRIQWISLLTAYKGHGSWQQHISQEEIDELNQKHAGLVRHWVVSQTS
jgi:hypothetical protein